MNSILFIVQFFIRLVSEPRTTWLELAETQDEHYKPDQMMQRYYYPLLGLMSLVIFLATALRSPGSELKFDYQYGMMQMVPILVAYFVGPYLAILLLKLSLAHFFALPHPDKGRLSLFVFCSTSVLMAVEAAMAMIPTIWFTQFFAVYLFVITWKAAPQFIRIDESDCWKFGFLSSVIIYFSPSVIRHLLVVMQG